VSTQPKARVTNWGRWGDDDERGPLKLLTPEVVRAGAAAITTGKVYSLGIPIQSTGVPLLDYRGTPMRLTLMNESDDGRYAVYGATDGTGAHEDILVFASHTTSHMDALCHVYEDHHHYNGVAASEMKTHTGAARLGIEKVGGFAGRGVLLDFPKLKGDVWLEPGYMITAADLDAAEQAQGVKVQAGDIVLVRTGYLDKWFHDGGDEGYAQAGIGFEAAAWLADRDVVAVGSDNAAVEVIPFDNNDFLGVHKVLLVQRGIYMLEFLNLAELAADECYTGLLSVAPLKVTGATGSTINPVFVG
jgi:kynurenine formamidase